MLLVPYCQKRKNVHQIEHVIELDEGQAKGWPSGDPTNIMVLFEARNGPPLRLAPVQHGTGAFFAAILRRYDQAGWVPKFGQIKNSM